jgi:hypothetical protein
MDGRIELKAQMLGKTDFPISISLERYTKWNLIQMQGLYHLTRPILFDHPI